MKNQKQLSALVRYIKILVFAAVLFIMSVIGLLWFLRPTTSVVEKRTLTEFPKLSWETFWDGSFLNGLNTWYADTYPLREVMIRGNQTLQDHYGIRSDQIVGAMVVADDIPDPATVTQPPVNTDPVASPEPTPEENLEDGTVRDLGEMQGSIYITDNCGYGLYYFTRDGADAYIQTMNQVYENVKDKVNFYTMIVPISAGVMLDQSVLDDMDCSNEGDAINYVYSQLNPGIKTLSIYDNLVKHNAEYIYFHTDHHWTQLGAYYAYEIFCEAKGFTPHKLEEFETVQFENYLGTYYASSNESSELAANPDTITAYVPKGTNEMTMTMKDGQTISWDIIHDVSDYPQSEMYATYGGGDQPWSYVHNPNITDGSSVLLIKDSYGNAFMPWLVDHYEHIYWIDFRWTENTISQIVEENKVPGVTFDVIFECSIYSGTTTTMLDYYTKVGQ